MDLLAPEVEMIAESGDEMMEDSDALYRDEDEDQLIVEEDTESTATPSVPAEVEMAPVDGGVVPAEVDEVLEVEEEGGIDIEVLPQTGGEGGEDVAFEDAEAVGGGEESSSKVDDGAVTVEEIVLEEEPSAGEKKEETAPSAAAAPPPSTEPSTTSTELTLSSRPPPASTSAPLSPEAESFVIVEAPSDSETNGKLGEEEGRKENEVDPAEHEGQSTSLSSLPVSVCLFLTLASLMEPSEDVVAGSHPEEALESAHPGQWPPSFPSFLSPPLSCSLLLAPSVR